MKSDLDALMQADDIDALLVTGPGDHNPAMVYLTNSNELTITNADRARLDTVAEPEQAAVLFYSSKMIDFKMPQLDSLAAMRLNIVLFVPQLSPKDMVRQGVL